MQPKILKQTLLSRGKPKDIFRQTDCESSPLIISHREEYYIQNIQILEITVSNEIYKYVVNLKH